MKNIPLPDLYYLENPDLKQLFSLSSTYKCNFLGADNKQ